MKLERYKDKKETRKKVILIGLTVITLISITMMLYKTFAKFTTTTSFPIMSGKVIYKKKILDFETDIAPGSSGNGELYQVDHGGDSGWGKAELRYGGPDPNNYVYFNCDAGDDSATTCELWRIIGLVNVQANSGVEQRLKIVRNESLGTYSWMDRDTKGDYSWKDSTLEAMLNNEYYNSSSSFANNNPKGLGEKARDMIDNTVSWGYNDNIKVFHDAGHTAGEWASLEGFQGFRVGIDSEFKGVGLINMTDYGYAVGGEVRGACLSKKTKVYNESNCAVNDWLFKGDPCTWTICPAKVYDDVNTTYSLAVEWNGRTEFDYATYHCYVHPSIYLTKKWALSGGNGSIEKPYFLVEKS